VGALILPWNYLLEGTWQPIDRLPDWFEGDIDEAYALAGLLMSRNLIIFHSGELGTADLAGAAETHARNGQDRLSKEPFGSLGLFSGITRS
jgi:hypothetical protein